MTAESKRPLNLYLSYAQKDEALKQEFEDYLAILQQIGLISGWIEHQVQRGTDWSQVIDPRLLNADVVIVLISPSLLASGYCSGAEVRKALERSETGEACVVPIILHHVNLTGYLFEAIRSIPRNGVPVSSWPDRSEAWLNIDKEIRDVIKNMTKRY